MRFRKKIFFFNSDFRYHRKMYRLFPCIPIFRGFFIKSAKRMCICDYVKNRIGTCEKCSFRFQKAYKRIIALGRPLIRCFVFHKTIVSLFIHSYISIFSNMNILCFSIFDVTLIFYKFVTNIIISSVTLSSISQIIYQWYYMILY